MNREVSIDLKRVNTTCLPLGSNSQYYHMLVLCIAVVYGAFFSLLPLDLFTDRDNYLNYTENSLLIFQRYQGWGLIPLLANEPLWLLVNAGLANWFPPEVVLRFIIFLPATLVAWMVLLRHPKQFLWLLFFLLFPAVLKNHVIHLRQGLAVAVFLIGWFTKKPSLRLAIIATTPFIHASFLFILGILVLSRSMTYVRLGPDLRTGIITSLSVGMGLVFAWLVSLVGARQGEYNDFNITQGSGLGFFFWLIIFCIWLLQGRNFLRKYAFESGIIILYLGTYWLLNVTARIFESGLLLVLLASLNLTGWRRQAFLAAFMALFAMQWLIRLGKPSFGFG